MPQLMYEEDLMEEQEYDELDYTNDLFRRTIDNIENGLEAGLITPEEAEELEAQATADLQDRLSELLGIDPIEAEYEDNMTLATFASAPSFGAALLELVDSEYEDADQALQDIQAVTGLSEDEIGDLLDDAAVPTSELTDALSSLFEQTSDEDGYEALMGLAAEAREEAYGYDPEEEDLEEEANDEDEELVEYSDPRVSQLENQIAEFQLEKGVKDALSEIERKAQDGISEGWLPPVARKVLLGNFEREDDRVAAFSSACDANGTDIDTMLFGINYALEAFKRCGPIVQFGAVVEEDISPREAEFQSNIDELANLSFQLYREQKGRD
jgi:hypothetical protein